MYGVQISRGAGKRAWAQVSARWSPEILALLADEQVDALTLGVSSQVAARRALDGLIALPSLEVLQIEWTRVPGIPVSTLGQVRELAVSGNSGERLRSRDLRRVEVLEIRPGRVAGSLAEAPNLEVVATRGVPSNGFRVFDGCNKLRRVTVLGRGVVEMNWAVRPPCISSILLSGVAVDSLEGLEGLSGLNDVTLESGRAAADIALDLTPMLHVPNLRVFAASGYARYVGADELRGTIERVILGRASRKS